ncbi:T9SS outer membrane translocon Sov/SprA [Urechidicola croceus]|uniref:T9SS outer membrane translocon Sov/SprA n=1 Tax=Urechidicola croceus TaxID=1850246 RepID=UPI001E619B90|nr:cell surface protein SprA [Urechidicola croceus]
MSFCTQVQVFSQIPTLPAGPTLPAQDSIPAVTDSIPTLPYNFSSTESGNLILNNPTTIEVIFDSDLQKYIIREKIGNYYVTQPVYLTPEEYRKYRLRQDMLSYNKEKLKAVGGRTAGSEDAQKDLLPTYYVNSSFFESLFGGNTIEVNPQGSVQVQLGILSQKTENPQISERNRKSTTFDFDQQISASINAKVGTRLGVTANYDTQSTFDFQNLIKLEYTPTEDDILQKIEVGNVSMPIKNSLVTGAQSLFGFKTQMQFGKTTVTSVFAEQKSQTRTVAAEGGSTINEFELRATDYDADRHFFLSQAFRDDYDKALEQYPLISSSINITRIEVWVTNRQASTDDFRNIVALADLAENDPTNISGTNVNPSGPQQDPSNQSNDLEDLLTVPNPVREISTIPQALGPYGLVQGRDYSVLENARRLNPSEFTFNPQLGYLSLNRRLGESDVLAVAYEYTVSGSNEVYKVGELTTDGVIAPDNLVVKLLRSEIINTSIPLWDLMMKNIYSLGAYQMSRDGFRFELLYRDDATGVPTNILQNAETTGITDRTLLNIFSLDRLDQNQFTIDEGDGYFDYVEGLTINSQDGYVIFPKAEPFGESLTPILTDPADEVYIFNELYENTQSQARNNFQNKDKYFLKGYYRSESAGGIPLGAFNVPQGSVTVTTGGRELIEGVDYVVDYQIGRVQIINPALEASNAPIEVSVENNSVFNLQNKRFFGVDVEHKFSDKLLAGATILNLRERPQTQKSLFNSEPINNTIFGLRADYGTEVPQFTKWVNKLPNIDTDVESNFSVRGDFAYLMPGSPKRIELDGEATSYLDDFEGAQIPLELKTPQQWYLASTPQGQPSLIPSNPNNAPISLDYGKDRARLSWYIIDQLFYGGSSLQPSNINDVELSRAEVRRIRYTELFPEQDLDITQSSVVRSLDLAYYPSERGSYNYDTDNVGADGNFTNPEDRWAGITRPLTVTNFEQANIEYIQFWMLDPYEHYSITQEEGLPSGVNPQDPTNQVGELYFNLGNISEDVLKDGRKMYENGLPSDGTTTNVENTVWGKIPTGQSLLYTFDADDTSRLNQDIGFDGLNDEEEVALFGTAFGEDPSSDNYRYFRGSQYDAENASILTRYKQFNNTQGNSPTANLSNESFPTSATTYPDVEDINKDQTMNSVESYYQYRVSLNANDLVVGQNHIVDQKLVTVNLDDGDQKQYRWLQFRIPINTPDDVINEMDGFNSIRFMRMFMTKFKMPVVLRFGELQLVRGDWRRYVKEIDETNNPSPPDLTIAELQNFQVGVVSIEQNESRTPIPYVIPPGIQRERLQGSTRVQLQNEQSLSMKVIDLPAGETRAVYKNVSVDLRMYKQLKMFVHLEDVNNSNISDEEMKAIIRLGSDLNDNYYEIEYPLIVSQENSTSAIDIWPNDINVVLENLGKLKLLRFEDGSFDANDVYPAYGTVSPIEGLEGYEIRVKGNPNLSNIRTMVLGVKNNSSSIQSGELWFNELRTSEFDNEGGWAAVVSADANFADFADVSVTGRMETIGFGGIEQRVNERNQEDTKLYDLVTNVNVGKVLPKKWGIQLPLNYSISEETHDPKYDAQYQDVLFEDAKDINPNSDKSQDYTKRRSISLINVRKERTNTDPENKPKFYDIENVSVSYAYNETQHKDYNVEKYLDQNVRASANYNYAFQPLSIEPFKNWGFLTKKKYLRFISDFNFNLLPSTISLNSNIIRRYNEQTSRSLVEDLPPLPTLKQRNFMFDWDYSIGYNLTRSLQFNFNATNNYVYDGFDRTEDISLFDNFFTVGRPQHYHQKLNGTYQLPIDKLPYLDFVRADYAYTADFDWQAGSQSYVDLVGNTIQNANTHNLSVDVDFSKFYKTSGITKLFTKRTIRAKEVKTGKKDAEGNHIMKKIPAKKLDGNKIGKGVMDVLMSIKKARFTYAENNGTLLPGYVPEVGFLGRDNYSGGLAPSLGFVFGSQIDIRNKALENGWLISRDINNGNPDDDGDYFNRTYAQTHYNKFDASVDISPFRDFDLEINATKIYTKNTTQQIDVVNDLSLNETRFEDNPITELGNFSMSYNMISTAFGSDADAVFQEFKNNREIIAQRLSQESGQPIDGFGVTSQQVMLPAFLAAYSGKNPSSVKTSAFRDIPLPNWLLTYKGLMRFAFFKKNFQSFTLTHGYRSSYSINNYSNNLLYDAENPYVERDIVGNFYNERLFSNVNLIEEFNPLVKVDLKMKNSVSLKAEVRKDRALNLNFNNNTLTEIRGKEYVVGVGYRIKDLKMRFKFDGKNQTVKGDLNLKADLTLRDNKTLIRDVDEDNEQVTGGQRLFSLKFLADYAMSRSLTASFYFDQNSSRYAISTSFPRNSFSTGLMIRYNLGN